MAVPKNMTEAQHGKPAVAFLYIIWCIGLPSSGASRCPPYKYSILLTLTPASEWYSWVLSWQDQYPPQALALGGHLSYISRCPFYKTSVLSNFTISDGLILLGDTKRSKNRHLNVRRNHRQSESPTAVNIHITADTSFQTRVKRWSVDI